VLRKFLHWLLAAELVVLVQAMAPLALIESSVDPRHGGVLTALLVGAEVCFAAPACRVLDRFGVARGLRVLLVLAAVDVTVLDHVDRLWGKGLAAFLMGGCLAGVSGGYRALLAPILIQTALPKALAAHGICMDLLLVLGPLSVLLLARQATAAMCCLLLASAVLVPGHQRADSIGGGRKPLPYQEMLPWLCSAGAVGASCSLIEVGAFARLGSAGLGTVAVGVLCGASILGGVVFGLWSRFLGARILLLGPLTGLVILLFDGPVYVAAAAIGLGTAALCALNGIKVQRLVPAGRRAEGFAALATVQGAAFACGAGAVSVLPLTLLPVVGLVPVVAAMFTGGGRLLRRG
jgi:hypothetical protein